VKSIKETSSEQDHKVAVEDAHRKVAAMVGTTALNEWNQNRLGDHQLDPVTVAFLSDTEITHRDRIAFALRELRRLGYEAEACPPDWTKSLMISSLADSELLAFGPLVPSVPYRRLSRIARRIHTPEKVVVGILVDDLYGQDASFDRSEYATLQEPYCFFFKGDPTLVESVFQAVGFATALGLDRPEDGHGPQYEITIAAPDMVLA
jgi:hypothetical protein